MPKQVKEAKNIEVLVNITYEEVEDKLKQKFTFVLPNKKYCCYLYDARVNLKNKIEELLQNFLLEDFQKREDFESSIVMTYGKQEVPKPSIRKIQVYIPPCFGCQYCKYAEEKEEFIFCKKKEKHYVGGVKRCSVFRSKDEILT